MKNKQYSLVILSSIVILCLIGLTFLFKEKQTNNQPTTRSEIISNQKPKEVSESLSTSISSKQEESTSEKEPPAFNSIDELMNAMFDKYDMDTSNLAISYYNFNSNETYHLNEQVAMMAASTNKVTTAVMFTDLVNQGVLTWDYPFYYEPILYEEGGGMITNGEIKASYSLQEVVYESLYHSDNTAWNMLINWYYSNIGDFQEGLKQVSGVEFTDPNINIVNYATSEMLLAVLNKVVTQPEYEFIKETMLQSQDGIYLKREFSEGFGAKYGQYDANLHDIGFYIKDGQPQYLIVVLSTNDASNELFLGGLNLQLKQFNDQQTH